MELVDILSYMGAETGIFQDMIACVDHIRFHRISCRIQHCFHIIRIYVKVMQTGHLQYGEIPFCKAAAEYGISSLQPPGTLVPLHPLKAAFQVSQ